MQLKIKDLAIDMAVKRRGLEVEVRYSSNGEHLGDVYVQPTGLIWCHGKTPRNSGTFVTWEEFAKMMKDYRESNPFDSRPPV